MLERGELPNLAALMARGVHAELETVEPVISPVVWTSIATGRKPEATGITDFYGTRLRMQVPTFFERLAASGRRVGLYDFLMTWPPATLPGGFVIPGWLRRDDSVTPPDVWSRIELPPFVADYDGLRSSEDYLGLARREVTQKAARWNQLMQAFDLDVGATTFYSADMTSHRFWRAAYPDEFDGAGANPEAAYPKAISQAMQGIDRSLGEIMSALSPDDSLLIASDHGFLASEEPRDVWVTSFREAAASVGLEDGHGFSVQTVFGVVILRVHPGAFDAQDALLGRLMELFESFRTKDGTPLLPVQRLDVASRPPGKQRPWTDRLRQWATRMLVTYWFEVQIDPNAHALLFAFPAGDELSRLWPDGELEVAGRKAPVSAAFTHEEFTGSHDPIGIFLAVGGPVVHRAKRDRISVLDIGPLVHYLAGDRIPDDLDGAVPTRFISAEQLKARPVEIAPAATFLGLPAGDPTTESSASRELTEKLRALGYVE